MSVSTQGIVLRQNKIMGDRRMLTVFTEKAGKVSVSVNGGRSAGRSKSSLAYRPFTLGSYDLYGRGEVYSMGRAEVVKVWYGIGEDIDRYMQGSFLLEFTDKLLEEGAPAPGLFSLLRDFFDVLEQRTKEHSFLALAYQLKAIKMMGVMPEVDSCVICGKKAGNYMFHVEAGGAVCPDCAQYNRLIYRNDSDIITKIKYIVRTPVKDLGKIYLEEAALEEVSSLVRAYTTCHLDISKLKSESIIKD